MDELLEIEAMLIRNEGAQSLKGQVDGYELLAMVVAPSRELRAQTLAAARERGVSTRARELAAIRGKEPEHVAPPPAVTPRRVRPRPVVVTIDDILAAA